MAPVLHVPLTDLGALSLTARSAEIASFDGRTALRLDGLALLPGS